MKCLHGELRAQSTTQNGSFWFCNQNPSCDLICSEDESYTYEKAIGAWKSTKDPQPRCEKHGKPAKIRVVKNLLKANYGRPFFVCSDQSNPCSFWAWGDVQPIAKPKCRHGSQCAVRKVKKRNRQQRPLILLLCPRRFVQLLRVGARRKLFPHYIPSIHNKRFLPHRFEL